MKKGDTLIHKNGSFKVIHQGYPGTKGYSSVGKIFMGKPVTDDNEVVNSLLLFIEENFKVLEESNEQQKN